MRRFKKEKIISVAALMICLALMSSCKKDEPANEPVDMVQTDEDNPSDSPEDSDKEDINKEDINKDDTLPNNDAAEQPDKNPLSENGDKEPTKTLPIYTIDDESLTSKNYEAEVPEDAKLTPELIVDTVVQTLAADNLIVGIDKVEQSNDTVTVSFKSDTAPLVNVGASEESAILDSISMSLLDNLDFCKNVIFQVEGEAYISGHFEFKKTEVYKWK